MGVNKNWIDNGYIQYLMRGDAYTFSGPIKLAESIDPGVYKVSSQFGSMVFSPHGILSDELIELPTAVYQQVIGDVSKFWTGAMKQRFSKYNLVYKRGILLHGPPGTGKTCTIIKVMEKIVSLGGIVLLDPYPGHVSAAVKGIREIEGEDKPVLVVFEELEDIIDDYEHQLLQLLDGEDQVDNVVYLAATNHIDEIPPRIKFRPSRFSSVLEVGPLSDEARRHYLVSKLHKDDFNHVDLDFWVEQTNGLTIDHLKDIIVSVLCFEHTIDDAVIKARSMTEEGN